MPLVLTYDEGMGETLSRADIQHAVQSALHDVRNDVSRISHVIDGMNRVAKDLQDLSRRVQNLERNVNQIQNTVSNTLGYSGGSRHPDPRLSAMSGDIYNLKLRFSAVEKFAEQMSLFVRKRYEAEEEDRQYRTV